MPGALGDGCGFLCIGADFFHFGEGGARHNKGKFFRTFFFFDVLTPQGQAIAVYRDHGKAILIHLKEGTGVDGAAFIVADGEDGLGDHGFQFILGNGKGILVLNSGKFWKFLRVRAQDVEFAHTAFDVDHIIFGGKDHNVVRELTNDLPKETSAQDQSAARLDIGGNDGADTSFQIIAGEAQFLIGFQKDAFQSGNGALWRHCAGSCADRRLKECFSQENFMLVGPPFRCSWPPSGEKRRG